jgi:protein-S-isoprenylcysteine O-methyltransferase Ste14
MSGRGGGWVVAQFALIVLVMAAVVIPPEWPSGAQGILSVVGAAIAIAGAAVAVWSARSLGGALTPFPRPVEGAALVESGPYRVVRHPVYSGGILFFGGWSLYAGPVALVLTAVLVVLWAGKTAVEERHLREVYPAYAGYAARVRWRLVPGLY